MRRANLRTLRNVHYARNLSLITETKIKMWIRTANLPRDLARVKTIIDTAAVRTSSCKIRTFARMGSICVVLIYIQKVALGLRIVATFFIRKRDAP